MVLSGDLKADGYVVLGLYVDVKAVFHGAQAHCGCLAVHEGDLGVEARAHDLVELAQALDDHGMLLLDHEEDIAGEGKDNKEKDENQRMLPMAAKSCLFLRTGRYCSRFYPIWQVTSPVSG